MASAELHSAPLEVVCIADALDVSIDTRENRRLHERLRANEVRWLRGARIKYGADFRVLDISAGGMRVETSSQLLPDANIVVELLGPESPILVPSRVVRCRMASLGEILKYQGACEFKSPLTIPELTARRVMRQEAPVARPVAPAPGVGWQKVIARFIDGRIVAGYTNDFHPSKEQLHLFPNPRQGESTFIPLARLKALFFVREFAGNAALVESKEFVDAPQGRKVEVTFHDNEIMVGSTLGYRGEGNGFFLHPADSRSNNLRVFVTAAGVRRMRFL